MNQQSNRLPALDPLKGFEAAARHLSFTRAAMELFLTQSAISRQIQTLEEQLGVALFRRAARRLALTREGELLYATVREVLSRLRETCAAVQTPSAASHRPRITVSAPIGFSALWLVPRLAQFQAVAPDVDVLISANNRLLDLDREEIDIAVRYHAPQAVPSDAVQLFGETVFPVASPALAATIPQRLQAADLAQITLLAFESEIDMPWLAWDPWLQGMGLAGAQPQAVLRFNQYDQMIRAAVDGRGIALGRAPLVGKLIAAGELAALRIAKRQRTPQRGYFLLRTASDQPAEVDRFVDWLLLEAQKTGKEMAR